MAGEKQEITIGAEAAKLIADGIASGVAAAMTAIQGPKKITIAHYNPNSSWHPDRKTTPKLKRVCFQNGGRIDPTVVADADILLLNQIRVSGKYFHGLVDVFVRQQGSEETVDIVYSNATFDKRMELKSHFRDLSELLQGIVKAQPKAA